MSETLPQIVVNARQKHRLLKGLQNIFNSLSSAGAAVCAYAIPEDPKAAIITGSLAAVFLLVGTVAGRRKQNHLRTMARELTPNEYWDAFLE